MIRDVQPSDAEAIARIYNFYVLNTVVTFEEKAISPSEMVGRIKDVQNLNYPWLILEQDQAVLGYAYASPWKTRSAYRFTAECTIYLKNGCGGQGLGTQLYAQLFARLKAGGFHAVIGVIALPNPASVALHERYGMKKAAHFAEVGWKFDKWIDVGYWEKLL